MAKPGIVAALFAAIGCTNPSPAVEERADETEGAEHAETIRLKLASARWSPFADHDARARVAVDLVLTGLARGEVEVETEILDPGRPLPIAIG